MKDMYGTELAPFQGFHHTHIFLMHRALPYVGAGAISGQDSDMLVLI